MHLEILNKNQVELLEPIKSFNRSYFMVGGTAISLFIGHRMSIDFDFFTLQNINSLAIKKKLNSWKYKRSVIYEAYDQLHYNINAVKVTFFQFPFEIPSQKYNGFPLKMPSLLTLAAMKAFALGGRGKWKDYVDLYFILKLHYSVDEIAQEASKLFEDSFNPSLFRKQLSYFDDINYSESVEFMPGFEVDEQIVKDFLIEKALEI